MDSTRGRRAQPGQQPIITDYQPSIKWTQDAENHLLHVDLPGFKREEIKVQVENSGKLTVRGRRQVSEGRYIRLDQVFDIPKDSILENISGKFEDGSLFLIMPKKVAEATVAPQKGESSQEKKEEVPTQRQKPKSGGKEEEKKEEDHVHKEKPKNDEEEKKKEEDQGLKEKSKRDEEKKKEEDQGLQEKSKRDEEKKKEEDPIPKEKPKRDEEEKKEEDHVLRKKPKRDEEKKKVEEPRGGDNRVEEVRKKGVVWKKKKIEDDDDEGWLDYGLVDDLLEKINRNRKVIAVAVVAFSIGFFVSRKLRSSGI